MVTAKLARTWLATLVLASGMAHAQSSLLLFEQALDLSLTTHPSVLSKRSEQAAAQADKAGAEWARYPTPSVEAATRRIKETDSTALVRIDQPLWTGGRITAGIDAADSRYDAATAAISESRLDLSIRVITSYTEALRQKDRLRHATVGVGEHEKLLEMIRRRVAQEVSSQADQRLAEARLLQARTDLSVTQQGLLNGLAQLSQLSGQSVSDVAWEGVEGRSAPPGLEAALQLAVDNSPVLRRLRYSEEAASADIDSRRSAYWPQLTLRLERAMEGSSADSRAMLVLTAQPGAGLSAASGVDAAISRRDAVRQERDSAEREVRERVTLDWNEWQAVQVRLQTAQRASEISNEVFESYARQYVIGRKTWIDVLNAVRESTLARFTLADARAQSAAASLRLSAQTAGLRNIAGY